MSGSYDLSLKAKLLRSLLKEYVPYEKHPFDNPSELSYVVSTLKTHKILSESSTEPLSNDLIDNWRTAVDSWLKRLLTLASSNSADKCWAGVCLLGVTSQECSSERLLASYVVWLNKIFSILQSSEGPQLVKSACCASLSDMFTRLSGFPNAKKDATSQATKFVQLLLKFFTKDISPVLLEEAISLLLTMIKFYPSSIHRHYDSVEAAIVTQLMSGKCSVSASKKLVSALALLPQSRGDEDSWSVLMLKILLCINSQLNDAFQCLEEESRGNETMWLLLPKGQESPPTLGGLVMSELSSELSSKRAEQLLQLRISTLMDCCSSMLTISYPVMVSLPIRGLIALAKRVLMVDGSPVESSYPSMFILKQEFVCSELPRLHLQSLDILMAVVKGLSSQLLPHSADIAGLLTGYLSSCKFSNLRVKAYSIIKLLLMSMGIGIAIHMNQDIIDNVFIDLDFVGGENSLGTYRKVQEELPTRQRKRKHSNAHVQEQNAGDGLPVEPLHYSTPISVKIAAVEALEALLTAGASVRSESWRANVDHLLITVAADACKESLSNEERNIVCGEPISNWVEFRLAALRALLASLLSPGRVRPSHLGLSLELFRKGVQETGTETAKLCGHALLSLEVLIHPRGLPLLDLDSTINNDKVYSQNYSQRHVYTFQTHTSGKVGPGEPEPDNDDLNEIWIGNNDETEMQPTEEHGNTLVIGKNLSTEKLPSIEVTHESSESRLSEYPVGSTGVRDRDDLMIESPQVRYDESEPLRKKVAVSEKDNAIKRDMVSERHDLKVSSSEHVLQTEDGYAAIIEQISATLVNTERSKGSMFEGDDELSLESFPDIVDGDPDSDSD